MNRDTLISLRDRVRAATGPDYDLDRRLFAMDYGWSYPLTGAAWQEWNDSGTRYTASIDAALALAERVLPGWRWTVYSYSDRHGPRCVLVNPDFRQQHGENGATPPLAIVCCAITALIDRSE